MKADYFDGDEFAEDMAQKTAHLGEDDIVEPKANVAAQAMQGLGFSLDEPDLKEMYLNLLATASTKGRDHQAHPAFAEIIRQLTSEEASALVPIPEPRLSTDVPHPPNQSWPSRELGHLQSLLELDRPGYCSRGALKTGRMGGQLGSVRSRGSSLRSIPYGRKRLRL